MSRAPAVLGLLALALLLGLAAPGQALASGDAAARRVVVKHVQRIRSLSDQYALCAPDRPLCIGNAAYRVYAYARDARRGRWELRRCELTNVRPDGHWLARSRRLRLQRRTV